MAVNQFAITTDQARNLESELTNTATHTIHNRVIFPRVSDVHYQPIDWPTLDLRRLPLNCGSLRRNGELVLLGSGEGRTFGPLSTLVAHCGFHRHSSCR